MPIVLLVFVTSSTNTKVGVRSSPRPGFTAVTTLACTSSCITRPTHTSPTSRWSPNRSYRAWQAGTRANTNCVQKVAKEVDEFLLECNLKLGATGLGEIRCGEPRPLASPSTCPVAKSLQTSSQR
ncbi:uncharacterized protein [Lolium perenne]|uniref:uncharacterized protein isoform X2 n=1 Tax=Lolium perenne TaxID=4522 RepID=UPI003A99375C